MKKEYQKLHIYGLGNRDVTIEFSAGMNVLYGLNEAAKRRFSNLFYICCSAFHNAVQQCFAMSQSLGGDTAGKLCCYIRNTVNVQLKE